MAEAKGLNKPVKLKNVLEDRYSTIIFLPMIFMKLMG